MARSATPKLALIGLLSLGSGAACTQQLELPGGVSSPTGGVGGVGAAGSGAGGRVNSSGGRGGSSGQGGTMVIEPIDATRPFDTGDASAPKDVVSSGGCRHFDGWRQMVSHVIVALDRSSSMLKKPDPSSSSRLQNTQKALRDSMLEYRSTVRFGYVEFPVVKDCRPGMCCASTMIPANSMSPSLIERSWNCANQPPTCMESTEDSPVAQALKNVRTSLEGSSSPPGSRHVLLLTDGEPACATNTEKNDCTLAVNEVNTLGSTLNTSMRVIGLTAELQTSQCLNDLATLGAPPSPAGVPPLGHTIAIDGDKLRDQVNNWLSSLSKEACSFRLPSIEESPTMKVYYDGHLVAQDPNRKNGWEFDVPAQPTRIIFYGDRCEELRDRGYDDLDFLLCER